MRRTWAARRGVQSLDRALDVLETLAAAGELGVSEVAARSGLVVSTAHRLLAGLANRGYVGQNPANGRYALGFKVLELAGGLEVRTSPLRAAARPHLERIQQATSETTNLVILDGDRVVYVDQVEGSHSVRMFTRLGSSALAHTTGSGKAILTYRPPEVIEKLYPRAREPFERLTRADAHHARGAARRLRAHPPARLRPRPRGARGGRELRGDAGVRPHRPRLRAISISGPTARIDQVDTATLGELLRRHGAAVSAALGHHETGGSARTQAV